MTRPAPTGAVRAEETIRARRDYAEEVVAASAGFPVYEVPAFVRERFPDFDPATPGTWPEPSRCTEGRPWGFDAYGSVWGTWEQRWAAYLSPAPHRAACRNKAKDPDLHLCGTHANAYRRLVQDAVRRKARYDREERHRELARRLTEAGITADGTASGVLLLADAAERLLALLPGREET